jgi:GntR family transcriptional repressor for pyruvate dehydrogenase complex
MISPTSPTQDRLYRDLARALISELAAGKYPVGTRLPAERELAARFDVSRPTVREAIIALEVQGLVEVRIGSGAHVLRLPGQGEAPAFAISAIEVTEARLLFEAESAALAATQISDSEITELEKLLAAIAEENRELAGTHAADRAFHIAIARATRNSAVLDAIERLWELRDKSPESTLLDAKVLAANVRPVVEEHSAILEALRARNPLAARAAMRAHLTAALDGLLIASEEQAVEAVRKASRAKRDRAARVLA